MWNNTSSFITLCYCHSNLYETTLVLGDNEEANKTAASETATEHSSSGLLIVCVHMHVYGYG